MAAATSILGVGIGAPLVQNGSEAVVVVVSRAVDTGKTLTIKSRDRTPMNGRKRKVNR